MVQRKVASKLGIQADQIKSEKLSATLGPSSHQNHDGKTRGTDLKKKMKRSRSMKLSSFDGSRSSLFRKEVPQPGRPPPRDAQMSAATPQKQSPVKLKGAVPNYMKSTSCSVARKECSQVTSQTTKTGSDSKNLHRRTSSASKPTPVSSGNTSPENLKRSSSLKLVRTLTKTPSFKPARSSVKRCSKVVLCADMDAQKATCSSTLKESKFPEYLTLNPGGTEAEGTSAMKVCPYTYCSLNGHHHARSPPLKCFLSARRRLMKTQKNAKVVPLSPNDGRIDSKAASEEEKIGLEFFVEIYAKNEDENSSSIGSVDDIKEEMVELEGGSKDEETVISSMSADKEKEEYAGDEHSDKRLSDASSCCEDDLKQNLEGRMDESDKMVEGASLCEESVELLESCSEDSDMEWDAGEYTDSELDGEATYSTEEDNLSCSDYEYISEIEDPTLHKIDAVACENMDSNWKDISDDQVLKEGKHASFEVQMPSLGMEVEGTDEAPQDSEPSHIFDYLSYSDDSSKEDEFEEVKSLNGSGPSSIEEVIAEVKSSFKEDEEENIPGADNTNANVLLNAVSDGSDSLDMIGDAPYDQKNTKLSEASEFDACPGLTEDEEAQVHTDLTTKGSSLDEEIIHNDVRETTKETGDNNESESEATILIPAQSSRHSCKADDDAPTLAVDDSEEQEDPRTKRSYQDEYSGGEPDEMGRQKTTETDSADSILEEDSSTKTKSTRIYTRLKSNHDEEPIDICLKGTIRRKRSSEPTEDSRDFMPKEPNFLPLPPEPDTERVDLRHQMTDDRKNSEEWMIDYALRQTVTKLAPARKRKVALLVEAFEKVMPTSKYETHVQSTSASSPHARPIQACS